MYNTDFPTRAELPTSKQLRHSTWIAAAIAAIILIFVVLPSEYGIDPTRFGSLLGLTQMGEIKMQLAAEAELDMGAATTAPVAAGDDILGKLDRIEGLLIQMATGAPAPSAQEPAPAASVEQPAVAEGSGSQARADESAWQDELSFTLVPGQGGEVKLVMDEGMLAQFYWTANGAVVNYDTHGDGGGNSVSYEKGRGVGEQEGELEAAFSGNHGWFWRNRTDDDVTVTLRTRGDYREIVQKM